MPPTKAGKYEITTTPEMEDALVWTLAEMKRENPSQAPDDAAELIRQLVRDRIGQVVRQHRDAQAREDTELNDLVATVANDPIAREKLKATLAALTPKDPNAPKLPR